ncbi:hypothetical protein [Klebsiella oxytoca]|uniref:hypothetical protein n=1 Tax=Klebsiella oxytoca TaxID=571 RepID=UPI0034D2871B
MNTQNRLRNISRFIFSAGIMVGALFTGTVYADAIWVKGNAGNTDFTGKTANYGALFSCKQSNTSGAAEYPCYQYPNRVPKNVIINCTLTTGSLSKEVDFTNSTIIGPWTVNTYDIYRGVGIRTTSNSFNDIYRDNSNMAIDFTATYSNTNGVPVAPLVLSCELSSSGSSSIGLDKSFTWTFKPPISAVFSASVITTNLTHKTRDYGIHSFKFNFDDTIWYTSRTLKFSANKDAIGCKLSEMTGALSYTKSTGGTVTDSAVNFNNTAVDLSIDNPGSATLKVKTKKSTAGTYSCSVTVTQTVL